MTANATVTLLFVDVVDLPAAVEQRRSQLGLLRQAIADHHGHEVKTVGDGLMVVFPSAVDAVDCAVAMAQAVERHNRRSPGMPFEIRIGLNVGEPTREGEDYFGLPVVLAKRLCDDAQPGEILVSDVVRALVGPRTLHRFRALEARDLKGVGLTAIYEVVWEPARPTVGAVPAALAQPRDGVFVGREREVTKLHAAWKDAVSGLRRAVLIGGEPGVGKTRLAAELAAIAQRDGIVLYGRCDEDLGVPYQPFAEALRAGVALFADDELAPRIGRAGVALGRLVPELRERLPDLTPLPAVEAESERYLLFEAVAEFIGGVSADQPILLVLDDLHWATKPTLMLLRHVLRSTVAARVLVVGTFRDTELDAAPLLAETLADLRRDGDVERISLGGLDRASVAAFVAADFGDDAPAGLADVVYAGTEGNPFFVGEVLRHLKESGRVDVHDVGLPPGVKDVIVSRLSRLSPAANQALALASVVGAAFELAVLERLVDSDSDDLLDALDEAIRARVILELPEIGHYTFAHALIRHVLLGELSTSRRARLHWRVAEAMASMPDADDRVEELAFHSAAAGAVGDADTTAAYAVRATHRALERLAYEPAVELAHQGLAALDGAGTAAPRRRAELFLALSEACNFTGDVAAMKEAARKGAVVAAESGWSEGIARAAVLYGRWVELAVRDPVAEKLCEDALDALGPEDALWRARVVATLANYRVNGYGADVDVATMAEASLAMARSAVDAQSVAWSLYLRAITLVAGGAVDERLAIADELLALGDEQRDSRPTLDGYVMRAATSLEIGDIEGFDADTVALEELADRLHWWAPAFWAGNFRITRAVLAGDFRDAEALAEEQLKRGAQDVNAFNAYAAQLFAVRRETGTLHEIEPLIANGVASNDYLIAFRSALALTRTELGRPEDARDLLDALSNDGFGLLPRDASFTACAALLAETAAALEDAARAATLAELLAVHRGRLVVGGVGIVCFGAADRYLGMLAFCQGDLDGATSCFASAATLEEGIGAAPALARTRYWWARALLAEGDTAGAARLLAQARDVAENLGMVGLARQVGALDV